MNPTGENGLKYQIQTSLAGSRIISFYQPDSG